MELDGYFKRIELVSFISYERAKLENSRMNEWMSYRDKDRKLKKSSFKGFLLFSFFLFTSIKKKMNNNNYRRKKKKKLIF